MLKTVNTSMKVNVTCTLCAENAAEVEEMAQRYGLKLHKHRGWAQLVPTR